MRNVSPKSLTIWISMLSSFLLGAISVLDQWFHKGQIDLVFLVVAMLLCFVISYITTRFLLQRFIFVRITPIYNVIQRQNSKDQKKLSDKEFRQDILGNLDSEVSRWNAKTIQEIELLKALESYRKDYVGNVSHELKTPLFSIQGFINTLLEGVDDKKMRRKFLTRAASNTDRLLSIVNDLEVITNIESGKIDLRKETFDLRLLYREIKDVLEIQAIDRGVQIVEQTGKDINAFVYADREKIRQVIANLVINSIKYGVENGRIELNLFDMDKFLMFEVSDNGVGIKEEHLKHVFDRFYRIDRSRSRDIGGSGLGLSIVKHFIEAHGQSINVSSKVGEGTSFSFTLPKAKSK